MSSTWFLSDGCVGYVIGTVYAPGTRGRKRWIAPPPIRTRPRPSSGSW